MKKAFFTLAIAVICHGVNAQTWSGTTPGDIYYNSGNVGIGTTGPLQRLVSTGSILDVSVTGANNGVSYTSFSDGVYSALHSATPTEGVGIWSDNQGNASVGALYNNTASSLNLVVRGSSSTNGLIAVKILGSGKVGIGTAAPDEMLTVNGTVHATEVKVTSTVPYPDYVFKPHYKLPNLSEVKIYINKNHHLPDMPTEAEVVKNGLNVGQSEALLLKKVEELTLYLIQQQASTNKQVSQLKRQILKLQNKRK